MADKITRIAIVDSNRCKPKRCAQECKKVRVATSYGRVHSADSDGGIECSHVRL